MEAAIRTPEILDLVFQYLRFTDDLSIIDERIGKGEFLHRWTKKRLTLLNAALTCRAFFQPAMANLWWTVPDSDLLEEDLERFDFYAKLVTHIIDLGRMGEDNVATVLIQLAELRPSRTCFPKLRTVRTNSYNPDPLLFFTSPTLQKLNLRGYWSEDRFRTMCGIIGRLSRRSQDLQLLDIPYIPSREAVHSLLQLRNIRHISFRQSIASSLNFPDFMVSLAELPRLEKLEVNCTSIGGDYAIPGIGARAAGAGTTSDASSSWFAALNSTVLEGTPANIITVLQYLQSTPLREIGLRVCWAEMEDIGVPPAGAADEVYNMTQTIHRQFSDSLKSVSLEYQLGNGIYIIPGGVARMNITLDSILPLLGIPQLERLIIDHTFSIPSLTDAFLQTIPRACPKLSKLSLPTSGSFISPIIFSFGAVQRLVADLPHLTELAVDFNAASTSTPGIVAPHLKVLDVRSSPIWNKRSTAVNIARAFPNLEALQYARETPVKSSHPGLWKEVVSWLPVITGRYNAANYYDEEPDTSGPGTTVRDYSYSPPMIPTVMMPPHPAIIPPIGPGPASDSGSDDPLGYDSDY
ncbi:hypothetical protein EST38_g3442 [Candolleomyces aberdarensis]|uniref:Uncharacterized protein n=1 Tax=Candolleomyces aberdarensis TaxID=2316362 RepID=A0A4Q2DS16_9AGAR|nr:hypothetical protein EST38_g3442 [Candolleomyces aberdarensis]